MLFLLAGTGFRVDMEYCCGQLESLVILNDLNIDINYCCGDEKTDDCHGSEEWVQEMEHHDLQFTSVLKVEQAPAILLPNHSVRTENPSNSNTVNGIPCELYPPPMRQLTQCYLC